MILVSIFFVFLSYEIFVAGEDVVYYKHPSYIACPPWTIERQGTIASPLFPQYPPYFYCEYVIKAPKGVSVEATFTEFDLPKRMAVTGKTAQRTASLCEDNYLEVKAKNLTQKGIRYCGQELRQKKITSEGSTMVLTFQSMPYDKQNVKGFKANIEFKTTVKPQKGQQYPCGSMMSADTNFAVNGSDRNPCPILIGAPAVSNQPVAIILKSKQPTCRFGFRSTTSNDPNSNEKFTTGTCNQRTSIPPNTKSISFSYIPERTLMDVEMIFSEKTEDDYISCGGTKILEMETPTELNIELQNRASARCLWILETPRAARGITFKADSMQPASDFHHMFHMIVSPKSLKDDILREELAAQTYRNNHLKTRLPVDYTYKFSELESESKVLMMLLAFKEGGNNSPRKFTGTVTAWETRSD